VYAGFVFTLKNSDSNSHPRSDLIHSHIETRCIRSVQHSLHIYFHCLFWALTMLECLTCVLVCHYLLSLHMTESSNCICSYNTTIAFVCIFLLELILVILFRGSTLLSKNCKYVIWNIAVLLSFICSESLNWQSYICHYHWIHW